MKHYHLSTELGMLHAEVSPTDLLRAEIEAKKMACEKRAKACERFANKPGTWEKDALLYRGQAQAYRECAELIGMILK